MCRHDEGEPKRHKSTLPSPPIGRRVSAAVFSRNMVSGGNSPAYFPDVAEQAFCVAFIGSPIGSLGFSHLRQSTDRLAWVESPRRASGDTLRVAIYQENAAMMKRMFKILTSAFLAFANSLAVHLKALSYYTRSSCSLESRKPSTLPYMRDHFSCYLI